MRIWRRKVCWLAVLLGLFVAFCWFMTLHARSERSRSSGIVVDASQLPAAVTRFGGTVVLTGVERAYRGHVHVRFEVRRRAAGHLIVPEGTSGSVGSREVERSGFGCSWSGDPPEYTSFQVELERPSGASRMDIAQTVRWADLTKLTKVKIPNVSPANLPVTRKFGPTTVTIEKAYVGRLPQGSQVTDSQGRRIDKWFVLVYSQSGPSDNFRGRIELTRTGLCIDGMSADPYWFVGSQSRVTDERGNLLDSCSSETSELGGGAPDVFDAESNRQTLLESVVCKISRRKASEMITGRAVNAARAERRTFRVVRYFRTDRLPGHFTWEASIAPRPDRKHRMPIIFKNVPLLAK